MFNNMLCLGYMSLCMRCVIHEVTKTNLHASRWFGRLLLEGKIITEDGGLLRGVFKRDKMTETPSVVTSMTPNKKVRDWSIRRLHVCCCCVWCVCVWMISCDDKVFAIVSMVFYVLHEVCIDMLWSSAPTGKCSLR